MPWGNHPRFLAGKSGGVAVSTVIAAVRAGEAEPML